MDTSAAVLTSLENNLNDGCWAVLARSLSRRRALRAAASELAGVE
jgi:hypothetical protein